jgi:AI-2 transport protein TqsA
MTTPTPPPPEQRTTATVRQDTSYSDARIRTTCLVVLTILAVGAALAYLRPVLVPLLIALLFTYCLKPVIAFQMTRLGLPRGVAIGGAVLVALLVLALAMTLVGLFAAELTANFGDYRRRVNLLSLEAADRLAGFGLKVKAPQVTDETIAALLDWAMGSGLGRIFEPVANALSGVGLVMLFVLFLLVGGSAYPPQAGTLLFEIETRAQKYILQMVGFSIVTGLLVGLSLGVIGVKFAFAFGCVAFVLNFIPTVGPLAATILPLPVVLLDDELSLTGKALAFALPAAIQLTFAVLQPRIQGEGQDLHPVTALAALVFFGSIWGILGAALAVPLTGVIKIVLERTPNTRPIADWMAGRFHGSPPRPPG